MPFKVETYCSIDAGTIFPNFAAHLFANSLYHQPLLNYNSLPWQMCWNTFFKKKKRKKSTPYVDNYFNNFQIPSIFKKIHKTTDIHGYLLNRSIKMCWSSSGFLWVMRTVWRNYCKSWHQSESLAVVFLLKLQLWKSSFSHIMIFHSCFLFYFWLQLANGVFQHDSIQLL